MWLMKFAQWIGPDRSYSYYLTLHVIKVYINSIYPLFTGLVDTVVKEVRDELAGIDKLSDIQTNRLRHKLKGVYAHIGEHPALQQRRMHVGSTKPNLPPPSPSVSPRFIYIVKFLKIILF